MKPKRTTLKQLDLYRRTGISGGGSDSVTYQKETGDLRPLFSIPAFIPFEHGSAPFPYWLVIGQYQ
jgi:hypothetical protein